MFYITLVVQLKELGSVPLPSILGLTKLAWLIVLSPINLKKLCVIYNIIKIGFNKEKSLFFLY